MKKRIFFLAIIGCILIVGCKKFLTTKPQSFTAPQNFYQTTQQATLALNGCFLQLTKQYFYAGYWQSRMVASCDDIFCNLTGIYPANFQANYTDAAFSSCWNTVYNCIEQCNVLLDNLENSPIAKADKNIIKGEALFLRAYCYFFLSDQWGPVPLRLKPTTGPDDKNLARSSISDVFNQILKDMITADSLVPDASVSGYGAAGYPSKSAVEGVLARVCLKMAGAPLHDESKYADADMWTKKVINSGLHSLDPSYQQEFINYISDNYNKKESLWEIDFKYTGSGSAPSYMGYLDGPGISGTGAVPVDSGNGAAQVHCTRILYNMYNAKDLRRDWNIAAYSYKSTGAHVNWTSTQIYDRASGTYRLSYTTPPLYNGNTSVNFPIIRYSDVLLMCAEAENEINHGPTPLAISCVNQVRERAWGKMLPGATNPTEADLKSTQLDYPGFKQAIEDERLMEFPNEGLRKHDLVRWDIFQSTIQKMVTDVTAPPAVVSTYINNIKNFQKYISNRDTLWPIPGTELQFNTLATQNPGW